MNAKNIFSSLFLAVAVFASSVPLVNAAPIIQSGVEDRTWSSYSYPDETISGYTDEIPENAVITEIGYGSDEHDWYIGSSVGEFYEKDGAGTGTWGVRVVGSVNSSAGTERRGVMVRLNHNYEEDTYMTRWAWASNHTSGGWEGSDTNPVNVCVHAKYRLFDPVTHQLYGPEQESGNCTRNGYQPTWPRGRIRAPDGQFLVNIWQFQFGDDGKMRGGRMNGRKLTHGIYDARGNAPLPLSSPLSIGTSYPARLLMENRGTVWWPSDVELNRSNECDGWEGSEEDPTCTYTKTMTSSNFKLRRVDAGASRQAVRLSTGGPTGDVTEFQYTRVVTVTLERSVIIEECPPGSGDGGGGDGGPILELRPGEPEPCIPQPIIYYSETHSPPMTVLPGANTGFDFWATPNGPEGTYNLQFQMLKADTNQLFGDVVTVPVTVGPGNPTSGIGLTCSTIEQIVEPGQVASYSVDVASQGGFAGNVSIALASSSLPEGVSSPGAQVSVAASSTATALVPVMTTTATPISTTTLTFIATAPGVPQQQCTSTLIVRSAMTGATLDVQPASQSVNLGSSATFAAWYDPDGAGGQAAQEVTTSSAWSAMDGQVASVVGPGTFRGDQGGGTEIRATYNGITDSATLTVSGDGGPTLTVLPGIRDIGIGSLAQFFAWYDPDGSGSQDPEDVSGAASWDATDPGVASSQGGGAFQGSSIGFSDIRAAYSSLTGQARLNVNGGAGLCTFSASPATLFIPPLRATTLSWQCGAPVTACTVSRVTAPGGAVTSGGASGSGPDSPRHTTTYRLTCDGGVQQDLTVRVFDVTTRIEILPR